MFDVSKEIEVRILSGEPKTCIVRHPTDSEWCARARRQKSIRRFLGRGRSETEDIGVEAADLELFRSIRIDTAGPEFDGAEAALVLGKLEFARPINCERTGNAYAIVLKVPGGQVVHSLRIPSAQEMKDHERDSVHVTSAHRSQELRAFLEPSGKLWDKLLISTTGYVGAVPITHKVAAMAELVASMPVLGEDDDPEE